MLLVFFLLCCKRRYLQSFPTRRSSDLNVYVGFMVWSNFTATKCRGLVSLNQVIKETNPRHLVADRKSGSAGMPRPNSYAVFCLKKKKDQEQASNAGREDETQ